MSENEKVIPVLICEDIAAEHDFLVQTLGFISGGVQRAPDGQAVHGEVRVGGLVIWLHRVSAEHKLASPRSLRAASAGLYVYVGDVDAHYASARSRGSTPDSEPSDMPYGQREYGFTDPEGHRWWFATPLK
jgi:uncharacterized glyoxalase superfamily protein PhnB